MGNTLARGVPLSGGGHALERAVAHGREGPVYRGVPVRRLPIRLAVRLLRHLAQDRLQVGRALEGAGSGGTGGPVACRAVLPPRDAGGRGGRTVGNPAEAPGMGTGEAVADRAQAATIAAAPRSIDDGGAVQAARTGEAEAKTAASRASGAGTDSDDPPECGVDSGL